MKIKDEARLGVILGTSLYAMASVPSTVVTAEAANFHPAFLFAPVVVIGLAGSVVSKSWIPAAVSVASLLYYKNLYGNVKGDS